MALLVTVSVPVRVPDAVGRKLHVDRAGGADGDGAAAGVGLQEVTATTVMPDTDAAAVPVLVIVTACAALVVLSAWPRERERARVGAQGRRSAVDRRSGTPRARTTWPAGQPVFAVMFTRT